jgi:O-antigen ligase
VSHYARPVRSRVLVEVIAPATLLAGAFLFGGLYAFSAARLSPWALPGLVALAVGAVVSYRHPAAGIAMALLVIPASTLGFDPQLTAYLITAWSAYLLVIAHRRYRMLAQDTPRAPTLALGLMVAYLGIALLSVTQASNLHAAGQLVRALGAGALLFGATAYGVRRRSELLWVLGGAAGGALIVGLHAVRDYLGGASPSSGFITASGQIVGRVTAGFSQPNQLGGFLVVIVPLAVVGMLLARRGRPVFAAAVLLASFGVYASFSRGALIGLVLVPFVFLRGWRIWLVGPLVALMVILSAPGLVKERFATLTSSGGEVATRVDIWRTAINIWENHPIIGVGLGGFPAAYSAARVPGKAYLPSTVFQPPPHAHNVFLQLLAEQGILGFLAFVALLAVSARTTLRLRGSPDRWERILGSGLLAALVAFVAHDMFDVTLEDPVTGLYVFVTLGLIAAAGTMSRGEQPASEQPAVGVSGG